MGLYRTLARPLLFRLPPEFAQSVGDTLLRAAPLWSAARPMLSVRDPRLEVVVAGLRFPNPVGAAAGVDKDCRFLRGLLSIGFGFAVGGTVTLTARPGNPRPRLLREARRRALINAMGFPGKGLAPAEARLGRLSGVSNRLMVSVSGTDDDDIAESHQRVQPLVAGVEVNVSSPNTAGLQVFHAPARLRRLLQRLMEQRGRPLFAKLPPWRSEAERDAVLPMVETAAASGVDGLVIANTHPVEDGRLAVGRGGLSGAPVFETTLEMLREARGLLPDSVAIVACGGVSTAEHVWQLMSAGASAVQLYTGLVYEGPGLPGRINRGLLQIMERDGVDRLPGPGGVASPVSVGER